jgi:hypothetical protein
LQTLRGYCARIGPSHLISCGVPNAEIGSSIFGLPSRRWSSSCAGSYERPGPTIAGGTDLVVGHDLPIGGSSNSGNSSYWGGSGASPHMLGKLKSRGSQGFIIGLQVANMRLPGMRRVGVLYVHFSSRPFFFYSHQGEQGYAQFPRTRLLGSWVKRGNLYPRVAPSLLMLWEVELLCYVFK